MGFSRLLKFFKDRSPFSARMPTVLAQPERIRKYTDIDLPAMTTYTQYEPPPTDSETVVLKSITKQCVLLQLEYRDYLFKKTNIYADQPEYIEKCYDLMQIVTADRPVKKEVSFTQFLLEMMPELFPAEILQTHLELPLHEKYKDLETGGPEHEKLFFAQANEIVPVDQKPVRRTDVQKAKPTDPNEVKTEIGTFVVRDGDEVEDIEDFLTTEEIDRRRIYVWEEMKQTFADSEEVIGKLAKKLGNVYSALDYIVLKGEQRTAEEQKVIDGMDRIIRLMERYTEYRKNVSNYLFLRPVLPFPMPDYLRKMYVERMKQVWQENYVQNVMPLLGVPDKTEEYKKEVAMRYQRALDLEALSEKDRKAALALIEEKGDELIVRRDLSAKDQALISKMNVLSNTVIVKKPPEPVADFSTPFNAEALRAKLRQQMNVDVGDGLLSPENIAKALFLNNARPTEFDLLYWAEVFNLEPQKIRNIFNHISLPIIRNSAPIGRLSFIDIPRKKTIVDLEEENLKLFRSQRSSSR